MGKRGGSALAALVLVCAPACSSVPKEVVELSYRQGEDLQALREAYDVLIAQFYGQLRAQRETYLRERWTPVYLRAWVTDGQLVQVARGELVWSDEADDFVPAPAQGAEQARLDTVRQWAEAAVADIADKRRALCGELDEEERELRAEVGRAFDAILRANAAVTAHLNSLREVQEVQDGLFEDLDLAGLRERIVDRLAAASERAQRGLERAATADQLLEQAKGLRGTGP